MTANIFHDSGVGGVKACGAAAWWIVRVSLLGLLMLLEPVVRTVLGLAMVLGAVAAVAFEISAVGIRFSFFEMLWLSFGCGVALCLYYGLIALLSR